MRKLFLAVVAMFLVSSMSFAKGDAPLPLIKHFDSFKQIPILDNGRIKPLDTYARNLLIQFSGKDTFEGKSAIAWLAAVFFNVDKTKADKVFLINNPDIAVALGIETSPHRRYSYNDLEKSIPKLIELARAARNITEKQRSIVENEIIRVFENMELYVDLSHEFSFALPADDFNGESFLDTALKSDDMARSIKGIEALDESQWSSKQRQTMMLLSSLFHWSLTYKNLPLTLIPKAGEEVWLSPWDTIANNFKNNQTRQILLLWEKMLSSYNSGMQIEFDMATAQYLELVHKRLSSDEAKKTRTFGLELMYNNWRPFLIAKIFYILTFILFCASFMSKARFWYVLSWVTLLAGFIPHTLALIARIVIMARPPVTSLYETFIFVSFIGVLLGIIIERVNKQWLGIVVASISGVVLLFIASKYSAEGDTLKMLIAVLNSNFWLSTHVTTITMGYGATCVAGILGHIWLIQASTKASKETLNNTFSVMMGILGLSLTLTFIGTNLGGIWADQSWGRFWGWDPKENGALMIVLWSTLLFHLRIAKLVGSLGMAVGTVLGMIVVMWAWFGVNLLSIGLHSYGFTSGVANSLLSYVICEIIFISITLSIIKSQPK